VCLQFGICPFSACGPTNFNNCEINNKRGQKGKTQKVMGNQLGIQMNSDDDEDFDSSENDLGFNVINFTVNSLDMEVRTDYCNNDLPIIRSKPDLVKFQVITKYPVPR